MDKNSTSTKRSGDDGDEKQQLGGLSFVDNGEAHGSGSVVDTPGGIDVNLSDFSDEGDDGGASSGVADAFPEVATNVDALYVTKKDGTIEPITEDKVSYIK